MSSEWFRFSHRLSIGVALISFDSNAALYIQVINQKAFKATFGQLRLDKWTHVGLTHLLNNIDKTSVLWKTPFDILSSLSLCFQALFMICIVLNLDCMILLYCIIFMDYLRICVKRSWKAVLQLVIALIVIQFRPKGKYCVFLTRNSNLMHIQISLHTLNSPRNTFIFIKIHVNLYRKCWTHQTKCHSAMFFSLWRLMGFVWKGCKMQRARWSIVLLICMVFYILKHIHVKSFLCSCNTLFSPTKNIIGWASGQDAMTQHNVWCSTEPQSSVSFSLNVFFFFK